MSAYERACSLYDVLSLHAKDGIFTGHKTVAYAETKMSMTYYSKTFHTLEVAGCIEVMYNGSPRKSAQLRLVKRPTEESIASAYLTKTRKDDTLGGRVSNLEQRLDGLDVKGIILNFEQRLARLEGLDTGGILDETADGR